RFLLSGKTVLILEDNALIALDIETVLDELGATNVVMEGGGSGSLTEQQFDLAIVDFRAAALLGEAFFIAIERHRVPVVFMMTDPEMDTPIGLPGQFEVVQKPFAYEDLHAAVARLMG
ncbi:MAG: hypothetical protein KAH44_24370, partial [Oricola sp.]|nr:hypothetical protein [Oricola sp.]